MLRCQHDPGVQANPGDRLATNTGRAARLETIDRSAVRYASAYNLTVDVDHTYHVGRAGILVHNTKNGRDGDCGDETGASPDSDADTANPRGNENPTADDVAEFTERQLREAERALRTNKGFRRWFHREYKGDVGQSVGGRNNPDLDRDLVRDAYEEWRDSRGRGR